MWLGSYTSQSLSIQNLNLKWCYIPVESHCKISVGGPCDIKKLFTSVRIPIVQADTIVVFFNGDRSNALLPMQWKYFTFVHEWSYLCSRNCWYLCVHVSAISLICQNWVYLQGSLELCTKLTCLWLELNLHKEQWLWRLWKVGRFAMLMGVSLYGYMQLYPWEVESCTAMIHTTHTHTHTHTHTIMLYRVFWSEWSRQNHGGKCEDETVQPPQCHEFDWSLYWCWSSPLHHHAVHGQWQSAILPQKGETKPPFEWDCWWRFGENKYRTSAHSSKITV